MVVPVLHAEWTDLVVASYAVPEEWLEPYLPRGIEPDLWQGSAWVSLVAFNFSRLHVLGVTLPYPPTLCTFPEINLRAYVKKGSTRAITFISEMVPNKFVACAANFLYKQHFIAADVQHTIVVDECTREARFDITYQGKRQLISALGTGEPTVSEPNTTDDFFNERYVSYGGRHLRNTTAFTVEHPPWRVYHTPKFTVNVDFETNYGQAWAKLSCRRPDHVTLMEGSAVNVYPWTRTP